MAKDMWLVSTHSHAKAAAKTAPPIAFNQAVSTHSRAEAAANVLMAADTKGGVSTHSRAEAAACRHPSD